MLPTCMLPLPGCVPAHLHTRRGLGCGRHSVLTLAGTHATSGLLPLCCLYRHSIAVHAISSHVLLCCAWLPCMSTLPLVLCAHEQCSRHGLTYAGCGLPVAGRAAERAQHRGAHGFLRPRVHRAVCAACNLHPLQVGSGCMRVSAAPAFWLKACVACLFTCCEL